MDVTAPKQWEWAALVPIAAGLYALLAQDGIGWWIFAGAPGALVLAAGMALLLMPGDVRITGYMAAGGLLGVLGGIPQWIAAGFGPALTAVMLFAASFLVAGRISLRGAPVCPGVPPPEPGLHMDAKAGLDEALLGYYVATALVPSGDAARKVCEQTLEFGRVLEAQRWHDDPAGYHRTPAAPAEVYVRRARLYGHDYERVSFDSEFHAHPQLPGAAAWAEHEANAYAMAWVLRHAGPPRPWLVCLHGYRMGQAYIDFSMFRPDELHHALGLNLLMPVMPLHGPRKIGPRSGDGFLDGHLVDLLHAQTQALWDLRRWLAWLRANEDRPSIGVYGASLGGYNAGLLAQYDGDFDFMAAAIPAVDFANIIWRFLPPAHSKFYEANGLDEARFREILRPLSPLALPSRLPAERLRVLGATGDRIVPPSQTLLLAQHWGVTPQWYQGSHLTLRREQETRRWLEDLVTASGGNAGSYATIA